MSSANSYGVGRLLERGREEALVEYFVSPAVAEQPVHSVPVVSLMPAELHEQTRCYYYEPEALAWLAGRLQGSTPISAAAAGETEDGYVVRFPNSQDRAVPKSALRVRWSLPIEEPTDHLAARVNETPFWHPSRRRFVTAVVRQRAAFRGLDTLASASVDLFEHQVSVIQRVLRDPVRRYLLADEVGLGKTIEAGVVISQHLRDEPASTRALVVVPEHLKAQWRGELIERFQLESCLDLRLGLLSFDELPVTEQWHDEVTMLVVDEAHQATHGAHAPDPGARRLYSALDRIATNASSVLLLSATPVLHNEDGFLAMLHLLDPYAYPLHDREGFHSRVARREEIADLFHTLNDDAAPFFLEGTVASLESLLPEDRRLLALCGDLRRMLAEDSESGDGRGIKPAVRALRVHIGETHRLHRRMLRTRRDRGPAAVELPKRIEEIAHVADTAREAGFELLEMWRHRASAAVARTDAEAPARQFFARLVEASLEHPRVLGRLLRRRRMRPGGPWWFTDEPMVLDEAVATLAGLVQDDARLTHVARSVYELHQQRVKSVVFCTDTGVADWVAPAIVSQLNADASSVRRADSEGVRAFTQDAECFCLVCDRQSEEGLNLQRNRAHAFHYDLPLAPNRLEQRVGRLDRLCARGNVVSHVITCGDGYEGAWQRCLTESVGVFTRSVASLQYPLDQAMRTMCDRLLHEGTGAIDAIAADFAHPERGLERELTRVRSQEALDTLEEPTDDAEAAFGDLVDQDLEYREFRKDVEAWVVSALHFGVHEDERAKSFQYAYSLRGSRPTLLPTGEFLRRFDSALDRNSHPLHVVTRPFTYDRTVAWHEGIPLLRIGHPFVESMYEHVLADDRGVAFAMWRVRPGHSAAGTADLAFRFDFAVEADLAPAITSLPAEARLSHHAVRCRADEFFYPMHQAIWLDDDMELVSDPHLVGLLEEPYSTVQQADGARDYHLRPGRWGVADRHMPTPDWERSCHRALDAARRLLGEALDLDSRCERYARAHADRFASVDAQLTSRASLLTGAARDAELTALDLERGLFEGLQRGIRCPRITTVSAGAVFLSGLDPFDEDPA